MKSNFISRTFLTKIIIQVVLLGLILPLAVGLIVQHYGNLSAYNQLIIEQGFQPYRNTELKCSEIYQSIIYDSGKNTEDWLLMNKIFQVGKDNNKPFWASSEQRGLLFTYLKDSLSLDTQLREKKNQLNDCVDHFNMDSENLAMLLDVLPAYQKNYQDFQKQNDLLNERYKNQAKKVYAQLHVPYPETLQDIDVLNGVLANPGVVLGDIDSNPVAFMQNSASVLNMGVMLRQTIVSANVDGYNIWQAFIMRNNQFFIKKIQERL